MSQGQYSFTEDGLFQGHITTSCHQRITGITSRVRITFNTTTVTTSAILGGRTISIYRPFTAQL